MQFKKRRIGVKPNIDESMTACVIFDYNRGMVRALFLFLLCLPALADKPKPRCPALETLAVSALNFRLLKMGDGWRAVDAEDKVRYFTEAEREKCRVEIRNGLLYDHQGRLLQRKSKFNFVLDKEGNLYVQRTKSSSFLQRHSSFFSGGEVACAGEIWVENGVIQKVNNGSGHYLPQKVHLLQLRSALRQRGVELPLEKMFFHDEPGSLATPLPLDTIQTPDDFLKVLYSHRKDHWAEILQHTLNQSDRDLRMRVMLFLAGSRSLEDLDPLDAKPLLEQALGDTDPVVKAEARANWSRWEKQAPSFFSSPSPD